MEPVLAIRELRKRFGTQQALDSLTLSVKGGELLGLLGPNGAGKSTLVRAIAGRVILDGGSISLFGAGLKPGDSASRASLGWVPQEIALYPDLTVDENLVVAGRYLGLQRSNLRDAIERALHWCGLADRLRDRVRTLSGGMKRRLNMAAGVLHDPRLILMDEPTVGVDPQSREKIYSMIEELRGRGVTLIYTTHYMEEAERLCDRIAVIDHGRIIAEGTKSELVERTLGDSRQALVQFDGPPRQRLREWLIARGAVLDERSARLPVSDPPREVKEILEMFEGEAIHVSDFTLQSPTLEAVFLHLTGRELRE